MRRLLNKLLGVSAALAVVLGVQQGHAAVLRLSPVVDRSANDSDFDGTWDTWQPLDQCLLGIHSNASGRGAE
jgi:hypothetical protein